MTAVSSKSVDVLLVHDADCPNVQAAREVLETAFLHLGLPAQWREREQASDVQADRYSSPTILVGGVDVVEDPQARSAGCRFYVDDEGNVFGAPPVEAVAAAIRAFLNNRRE